MASVLDQLPQSTLSLVGNRLTANPNLPAWGYPDATGNLAPDMSRLQYTYSVDGDPNVRIVDYNRAALGGVTAVLPPRPAKKLDVQSTDKDTSISSSAQPIHYDTSNTNEPQQDQFIENMINSIIAKSISDAASTTKILEQTRGTIAKTQYYRNPNIRDDSNNVVKPNYKIRSFIYFLNDSIYRHIHIN